MHSNTGGSGNPDLKNKDSKGKQRESFNPRNHFLDDYQHYPAQEHQKVYPTNELIYSVSLVSNCWASMLVEEHRVAIPEKSKLEGQT
jgi:hypothetical protein